MIRGFLDSHWRRAGLLSAPYNKTKKRMKRISDIQFQPVAGMVAPHRLKKQEKNSQIPIRNLPATD